MGTRRSFWRWQGVSEMQQWQPFLGRDKLLLRAQWNVGWCQQGRFYGTHAALYAFSLAPSSQTEMIKWTSEVIISRIISKIKVKNFGSSKGSLVRATFPISVMFLNKNWWKSNSLDFYSLAQVHHWHRVAAWQKWNGMPKMCWLFLWWRCCNEWNRKRTNSIQREASRIICSLFNLIIFATCKAIPEARDLFDLLE